MRWIIDKVVYDTEKATLLATSERSLIASPTKLYRANNGTFFRFKPGPTSTEYHVEPPIVVLSEDEAIKEYNRLEIKKVDYKKAFPYVEFREA